MATEPLASPDDVTGMRETIETIASGVHVLSAEGGPNVVAIEGDEFVVCFDARAAPAIVRRWLAALRERTAKPIRYLVLSHYHQVRAGSAPDFGAELMVSHEATRQLIVERMAHDRVGDGAASPLPTLTLSDRIYLDLGSRGRLEVFYPGRGHTDGDVVAWLPRERLLLAGELIASRAAPSSGEAYHTEWMTTTLDRLAGLGARLLVTDRGPVCQGLEVDAAIKLTRAFLQTMHEAVWGVLRREGSLRDAFQAAHRALAPAYGTLLSFEHSLPLNVQRLWDELLGQRARGWTAERERALRATLHS